MGSPPLRNGRPMTTIALTNGLVLLGDRFARGHTLILRAGRIVQVVLDSSWDGCADTTLDLKGLRLAPGFIDAQVNGGGDCLFNDDPSIACIERMLHAHRRFGTTAMLPTLVTAEDAVLRAAMRAVEQAIAAHMPGVLGIHLEGPALAEQRKGVHDSAKFRPMDKALMQIVCSLKKGITLVTLAPERADPACIRQLTANGVIVSLGHTNATYEAAKAALAAGASGFTHTYNAMSPLASRAPGAVGAALDDQQCHLGMIADGHHVHWPALRIALRAKPRGKCFLVTDAMPPVGGAESGFQLGGQRVNCQEGRCISAAGNLAGACLDMASAVRLSRDHLGITLAEACRMASAYPAAFLGLAGRKGAIAQGFDADLVAFDDNLQIKRLWQQGREVAAP